MGKIDYMTNANLDIFIYLEKGGTLEKYLQYANYDIHKDNVFVAGHARAGYARWIDPQNPYHIKYLIEVIGEGQTFDYIKRYQNNQNEIIYMIKYNVQSARFYLTLDPNPCYVSEEIIPEISNEVREDIQIP